MCLRFLLPGFHQPSFATCSSWMGGGLLEGRGRPTPTSVSAAKLVPSPNIIGRSSSGGSPSPPLPPHGLFSRFFHHSKGWWVWFVHLNLGYFDEVQIQTEIIIAAI